MMHPNFYHWHSRTEFKPDVPILKSRWNAAEKFAKELSATDACSLLRFALFPIAESEFAKRFSAELVKAEPTFPPDKNAELLRVMATAAIHSRFKESSEVADALALGLQAADFPQDRIEPICPDIMISSGEYLVEENEKMRPQIDARNLGQASEDTENYLSSLKEAIEGNNPQEIGKATEQLGRGLAGAMEKSHQELGEIIERLAEESQFLWWLVGRRSPSLNVRREKLSPAEYALPAAQEAGDRVVLLPPAASVESLLNEALSQCDKNVNTSKTLIEVISSAGNSWLENSAYETIAPEVTPITALLAEKKQTGKVTAAKLRQLALRTKAKFTPVAISQQYFKELMFLRAVNKVS